MQQAKISLFTSKSIFLKISLQSWSKLIILKVLYFIDFLSDILKNKSKKEIILKKLKWSQDLKLEKIKKKAIFDI